MYSHSEPTFAETRLRQNLAGKMKPGLFSHFSKLFKRDVSIQILEISPLERFISFTYVDTDQAESNSTSIRVIKHDPEDTMPVISAINSKVSVANSQSRQHQFSQYHTGEKVGQPNSLPLPFLYMVADAILEIDFNDDHDNNFVSEGVK